MALLFHCEALFVGHPILVCVLHDFITENDMTAAWHQCKDDDFGVLPAPQGCHHQGLPPITASLTKLRGWLLHLKVPSQFIMKRRLLWSFHHPPKDQQAEEFDH